MYVGLQITHSLLQLRSELVAPLMKKKWNEKR